MSRNGQDIDNRSLWGGTGRTEKSISDLVYSRNSGTKKESARYILEEEDACLATVGGQGGAKGPDWGWSGR